MKKNLIITMVMTLAVLTNSTAFSQAPDAVIVRRILLNAPGLDSGYQYTLDQQKILKTREQMKVLADLLKDPKFKNICEKVLGCGVDLIGELTPQPIMVPVPEILLSDVDPSRFPSIEKLMTEPKTVLVTIPPAPVVVSQETTPEFTLNVSKNDTIQFIDFAKEDGDIISVYFDNNTAYKMISIEHVPFIVPFDSNIKSIEIVAENEGTSMPCTLRVLVNNKYSDYPLQKGESVKILRK